MKLSIYGKDAKETGKKQLPAQFDTEVRLDLIKRAYLAVMANTRAPYGADTEAGKKQAASLSRRRRKFKGAYGKGISRVPRKTLSRQGTQFSWVGAFAPGTVGGRQAHPPKSWKEWGMKINDKERKLALRSALAATMKKEIVETKHRLPKEYPMLLSQDIEKLGKTSEVYELLKKLGFSEELMRTRERKIRAGTGKSRGRKYVEKKGILIVVSEESPLLNAAQNLVGVDVTTAQHLNARLLAPGGRAGRCTLFTEKAIDKIAEKKMFEVNNG